MNKLKYWTPREISLHVTTDDLWVSVFGKVLNLSPLFTEHDIDEGLFPLLVFAGKDISHLFDEQGEVKLHVNPDTNKISPFLPFKPLLDSPSEDEAEKLYLQRRRKDEKMSEALMEKFMSQRLRISNQHSRASPFKEENQPNLDSAQIPWWKDDKYVVGLLTCKPRWIKVMNTLIMREVMLEVCSEETIEDIVERYLKFNRHARSYTWKYHGQVLQMNQTLELNGIRDYDEVADHLRLNSADFIPTLILYFNDDLTEF